MHTAGDVIYRPIIIFNLGFIKKRLPLHFLFCGLLIAARSNSMKLSCIVLSLRAQRLLNSLCTDFGTAWIITVCVSSAVIRFGLLLFFIINSSSSIVKFAFFTSSINICLSISVMLRPPIGLPLIKLITLALICHSCNFYDHHNSYYCCNNRYNRYNTYNCYNTHNIYNRYNCSNRNNCCSL